VKIALADSAGMGLPAAREAGEKAVDAVRAARELEQVGELFDHMDAVVQLNALEPDADVPPIPGPTPRFMAAATVGEEDDDLAPLLGELPEVAPGLRPGKVQLIGGDGRSLSEALSELDGERRAGGSAAFSGDSVEKTAKKNDRGGQKKRSRGETGQEADSAAAAVAGLTVSDEEGDTPTAQKVKTRGCSAGCGDFFSWASGGLFGTPAEGDAAPRDEKKETDDAFDAGVAEELASSVKAAKNKE
jgi:hypothetical protein